MGKQTKKAGSDFGGEWTQEKLEIGGTDWEEKLYKENPQISMFPEHQYIKEPVNKLEKLVTDKLKDLYGGEPKIKLFKNTMNSPLFLLCFFITNPSEKAYNLASKVVKDIFIKIDRSKLEIKGGGK